MVTKWFNWYVVLSIY